MAWDFLVKLRPIYPRFVERAIPGRRPASGAANSAA